MTPFQNSFSQDEGSPQAVDVVERETLPGPPASPGRPQRCYRAFKLGREIEPAQQSASSLIDKLGDRSTFEKGVHTRGSLQSDVCDLVAISSLPVCDPDRPRHLGFAELLRELVDCHDIGEARIVGITDRTGRAGLIPIQQVAHKLSGVGKA